MIHIVDMELEVRDVIKAILKLINMMLNYYLKDGEIHLGDFVKIIRSGNLY